MLHSISAETSMVVNLS